MGCGSSSPAEGAPPRPSLAESRKIDSMLQTMREREERKFKALLLGAGESGKSTIFKQMRLLYGKEFSDDDLRMYGVVARSNIVVAIRKLCTHLRNLGLEEELDRESKLNKGVDGMTCRQAYDELVAHLVDNTAPPLQRRESVYLRCGMPDWVGQSPRAGRAANEDAKQFLVHHQTMHTLWQSDTMKQVWAKRSTMNVVDSHKEFLNDIPRIASPDYRPTTQDVLIARVRTTQVVVESYRIDGVDFEMYDVGGQRSERRKWVSCFDEVTCVIFVASLSEFDQTLAESKRTNRMVETIELFRTVCNNPAFANASIMLFLNKRDIFAEKILHSDIASQGPFSDYAGKANDYAEGMNYFIEQFKDCFVGDAFRKLNIHVTCATDTSNMEFVLNATSRMIMADNVKRSGLLLLH